VPLAAAYTPYPNLLIASVPGLIDPS